MRSVPATITAAWELGQFIGVSRPMARVTIQRMAIQLTSCANDHVFSSAIFGQNDIPRELPNIKSVKWDRSIGADAATCTIELYNTVPLPLGTTPEPAGDFGRPGYYTPTRGTTDWSGTRWGHEPNSWQNWLLPDRIIRTYEGYGFDPEHIPETDPFLVQTGEWLIDDVEFTTDGLIVVNARDLGRLLLDQLMFPPIVPVNNYPLSFSTYHEVANPPIVVTSTDTTTNTSAGTFRPTYATDSGVVYNGSDAAIYGHYPHQAFDGSTSTYWLSIGNASPSASYAFEYIQGSCGNKSITAVHYSVYGGPYRVYLSLMQGGLWRGNLTVPYNPNNPVSAPNGANIKYIASQSVARGNANTFSLPLYNNVQAIRLTFASLYNSGLGTYPYRAGVRDVVCDSTSTASNTVTTTTTIDGGTHTEGNYGDYTEIVKLLLAYGGFYWPNAASATFTRSDGSVVTDRPTTDDPYLGTGRVWGDLQMSGTAGIVDLTMDIWDKKPLMDGISYVRDILGFIFFIDEGGGAVFRMPNIWTVGNIIGNNDTGATVTTDTITIDERNTLMSLRAKLSSRNIRENVFVADVAGQVGAVAAGFNPVKPDPGLRRVGGYTDQHFSTNEECQKMADLITIRQMFEYRSDSIKITANPAIQIDDQVRIYERVTNEGYLHYVKSISSMNDLENGQWTYDMDVHWLGESPGTTWAFDPARLSAATQTFIEALKKT